MKEQENYASACANLMIPGHPKHWSTTAIVNSGPAGIPLLWPRIAGPWSRIPLVGQGAISHVTPLLTPSQHRILSWCVKCSHYLTNRHNSVCQTPSPPWPNWNQFIIRHASSINYISVTFTRIDATSTKWNIIIYLLRIDTVTWGWR